MKKIVSIIAAAILAIGIGAAGYEIGNGFAARSANAITVTGYASVSATADNVSWQLYANESAPTAANAVKNVENDITALTAYLTKGGVTTDQISLGAVSTNANHKYLNGNDTGQILSYQANQSLTVKSSDVQLINTLSNGIGVLLQTGSNIINNGPQFYVSNLTNLRPELLAAAMKDAKVRAQAIVSAAGGKVGPVLSVTSGPFQVTTPDSTTEAGGGSYDTTTIPKTISTTVTVAFKSN